jgi:hypothetical protein
MQDVIYTNKKTLFFVVSGLETKAQTRVGILADLVVFFHLVFT